MKNLKLLLSMAGVLILTSGYSQCRNFVSNYCAEAMGDYIPNENFNGARLSPGDMAEINMTFYADEKYRLLVCSHPSIGDVDFQIVNRRGETLFNNTEEEQPDYFDFSLEGTQELTVKLKVNPEKKSILKPQGCVAILVGRMITP